MSRLSKAKKSKGEKGMELYAILLCAFIGYVIAKLQESPFQRRRRESETGQSIIEFSDSPVPSRIGRPLEIDYQEIERMRRRIIDRMQPEFPGHSQTEDNTGKTLIETWRKSIVGLIKLAEENLESAKHHFIMRNFNGAFEAAATSVENIARALIHCYGGKPDSEISQEEVLKMLANRLSAEERKEFEKAVEDIARIGDNKMTLKKLANSFPSWRVAGPWNDSVWLEGAQTKLFDETGARQIVNSASKIISLFKRIIINHFTTEIPEIQ
jgi:HEPN domain-containing protein